MPLDALGANGGLDEFRVDSPREVAGLLRQLMDTSATLNLSGGEDNVVASTLWSTDSERGTIGFSVDPADLALARLLEADDAVAVGYLDNVKLQFDIAHPMLVHGDKTCVLSCRYPREIYRFQRRGAFRVKLPLRNAPAARMRHSAIAEMQLTLRVVDISIGGCALFLPDDMPALQPGSLLNQVEIELDVSTRFSVDLKLHHVTSLGPEARGVRLGCEFMRADPSALRTLQRFIDLTQKRGKLLSLN